MMNAVLVGVLSAELLRAGVSATDYPFGSFWPDEQTLPMESCVGEFSFRMKKFTLVPPVSDQKTSIVSMNAVEGELLVRARRQVGCTYDCRMKMSGDSVMPVICSKVGSV